MYNIIMVNTLSHNITYTYAGPCASGSEPIGRQVINEGGARRAEVTGLRPYSNYTVTLETVYPSDVVSTTVLITTLPSG